MERLNKKNKVGYFYVGKDIQHESKEVSHPESSKRLSLVEDQVRKNNNLSNLVVVSQSELIEGCVELTHDRKYTEKIKSVSKKVKNKNWYLDRGVTYIDSGTFEAAYLAASTACVAIKYITDNKLAHAFCAVRPPGHHASSKEGAGFCIFNNAAVASKFFLDLYPDKKVLIIDWDTHFGNGTFSIVGKQDSIYFFDISTVNFPNKVNKKPQNKDRQSLIQVSRSALLVEYLEKFNSELEKISKSFSPDIILISAGFDTHKDDPMRGFSLDESSYYKMTRSILKSFTNVPIISVLEGGYNPEALALSIEQHLLALTMNE